MDDKLLDGFWASDAKVTIPKRAFFFEAADGKDWVTVTWGGYEYDIELKRIPTPLALLQWIAHMGPKGWEGMTADEIADFICAVCRRKRWHLWDGDY